MASVFLSYDREDAGRAAAVAGALERANHSVWWDRQITGGLQYGREIEQALKKADAVVVLWSERSVESAWVRDEAAAGRDAGKLVPVKIDATTPPMGFRQYQTIDLSRWKGRGRASAFKQLLTAVEQVPAASAETTKLAVQPLSTAASSQVRRPILLLGAALLLVTALAGAWYLLRGSPAVPTVAVAAADPSAPSRELTRDLLVKLGSLRAASAGDVRLTDVVDNRGPSAFVFEAGASGGGANLLLRGTDGSVLWSKDFSAAGASPADVRQQVAATAGKVLQCGLEAVNARGRPLDQSTLKLYLNGCASMVGAAGVDTRDLVTTFREVTERVPDFVDGWGKLLLAEAEMAQSPDFGSEGARQSLRQHIVAARRVRADLPEAFLAEADLLGSGEYSRRAALLDKAVSADPENPNALYYRSQFLIHVGRHHAAIQDAEEVARLDPLSPAARDAVVAALTYAGRIDEAIARLDEAEKLWPGANNLRAARYRLHLRYGDPREALRILNSGTVTHAGTTLQRRFVEARIDRRPETIDRVLVEHRAVYERYPEAAVSYAQALAEFGRVDELMQLVLSIRPPAVDGVREVIFRPTFRPLWHHPRFMAAAQRIGVLDYWRTSGNWPDFCADADLPYDCKAEAAKLAR